MKHYVHYETEFNESISVGVKIVLDNKELINYYCC